MAQEDSPVTDAAEAVTPGGVSVGDDAKAEENTSSSRDPLSEKVDALTNQLVSLSETVASLAQRAATGAEMIMPTVEPSPRKEKWMYRKWGRS